MTTELLKVHEDSLCYWRRKHEEAVKGAQHYRAAQAKAARLAVLAGMSKSKVAKLLGVSRPTLYAILDR